MEEKNKSLSLLKEQIEKFEDFIKSRTEEFNEKDLNDVDKIKEYEQKILNIEQELSSAPEKYNILILDKLALQQDILIVQNRIRIRQNEILCDQQSLMNILLRAKPYI